MKRGFATKKEAQEWERVFLQQQTQDLEMPFSSFYELYKNDMKARLNTQHMAYQRAHHRKKDTALFSRKTDE